MKRLIAIIVTGALTLMFLLPNSSLATGVKGGIKIGVSSAKLHGEDVEELDDYLGEDLKSNTGICAAGFITINITEMFAIQPEVLYIKKGTKYEEGINGETGTLWFNLTYLEIPVLAKIMVPTQGSVKPFLFAGPAVALKLSTKLKAEVGGDSIEVESEELNEMLKGTDFGLVIGGGLDIGLGAPGTGSISVDIRYSLGLTNIFDVEGEEIKVRNGAFSLMVGFSF